MGNTPTQIFMLDEPTNNVDLESIVSFEQAHASYKWAIIVVSHDDTFLQNICVEKMIEMGWD